MFHLKYGESLYIKNLGVTNQMNFNLGIYKYKILAMFVNINFKKISKKHLKFLFI